MAFLSPGVLLLAATLIVGYFLLSGATTWPKILLYGVLLLTAGGAVLASLGTPKPAAIVWPEVTGKMVAYHLDEGHAIYVWLLPDGAARPLYASLPWTQRGAAQIEQASAQGKKEHRAVEMTIGLGHAKQHGKRGHGQGSAEGSGNGTATHGQLGTTQGGDSLEGPDGPLDLHLAEMPQMQRKDEK